MTNRFSVKVGTEQKWQNALRFGSGPFSVSGHTTRTKGVGGEDLWPLRGDCWDGGQNIVPCSSSGHERKHGRDTWRWEKLSNTYCTSSGFLPFCRTTTEEDMFNKSYDGGTETGYSQGVAGYLGRPTEVRNGAYGSWSRFAPGSERDTTLDGSFEHGGGAEVSVNWPSAYSSSTFSSTMTHLKSLRLNNHFLFRGDLPWFTTSTTTVADTGEWYRYDFGTSWKLEYWSCRWAPGWTGGSPCWNYDA